MKKDKVKKRPALSKTAKSYTKIQLPKLQETKDALQQFSDEITVSSPEYRDALKGPIPPQTQWHPDTPDETPTFYLDTKTYSHVVDVFVALAISSGFIAFGMALGLMK